MRNIEMRGYISFLDEGVITTFFEGDNVICYVGDEKKHVGIITAIGLWKENDEGEPHQVICINTSKNSRSISSEIVKIDEITYICKNSLIDKELCKVAHANFATWYMNSCDKLFGY